MSEIWLLILIGTLSISAIGATVIISVINHDQDNMPIIAVIMALVTPILAALVIQIQKNTQINDIRRDRRRNRRASDVEDEDQRTDTGVTA